MVAGRNGMKLKCDGKEHEGTLAVLCYSPAMRVLVTVFLLGFGCAAYAQTTSADDAVRVAEFYRLAPQIEDYIWSGWSKIADPLLLITPSAEFLTHFPATPEGFKPTNDDFLTRPRQFPTNLQATFPAFGPPSIIAIGEPSLTASKTSTPWEIVLMHEHFHQLQYAQPGYFQSVAALGLSHGDQTGMWILNYPFPYTDPSVAKRFAALRDQLLLTVGTPDGRKFRSASKRYLAMRRAFLAQLSPDDHKYLSFQLWQEGIARYTQIAAAEAAACYHPTEAYQRLPDYEPFSGASSTLRSSTLNELREIDLAKAGRVAVYSFGAVEGILLDRLNPQWKNEYFQHTLTTDPLFALSTR
jgi:hypothetical protein